jgi:cell shape-determining protein MreC
MLSSRYKFLIDFCLHINKITIIFSDASNTKFVLDRINQAEKYLGTMCVQFGKVCRKEARVRDCNDELVQNMFEYADRERINTSFRQSLQQYASYLSAVEDYRNTLVSLNL